jgi:carboxypeptidase C (cathepsin A)
MAYYEAGHMMYIHLPSLMQLKEDLANFVSASSHLTPDHLTPDHLIL